MRRESVEDIDVRGAATQEREETCEIGAEREKRTASHMRGEERRGEERRGEYRRGEERRG